MVASHGNSSVSATNESGRSNGMKTKITARSSMSLCASSFSGSALAVNCPRYAEAIDQHAKADGPKRLLQRHFHRPFFCPRVEDTFRLGLIFEAKGDREALWFLIAIWRSVRTHQFLVTHHQSGMKNLLMPFGRHGKLRWRAFIRHYAFNFAAEAALVELERCFALAVETKIRSQLHTFALLVGFSYAPGLNEPEMSEPPMPPASHAPAMPGAQVAQQSLGEVLIG